mgnify:CR=1 FL=1
MSKSNQHRLDGLSLALAKPTSRGVEPALRVRDSILGGSSCSVPYVKHLTRHHIELRLTTLAASICALGESSWISWNLCFCTKYSRIVLLPDEGVPTMAMNIAKRWYTNGCLAVGNQSWSKAVKDLEH